MCVCESVFVYGDPLFSLSVVHVLAHTRVCAQGSTQVIWEAAGVVMNCIDFQGCCRMSFAFFFFAATLSEERNYIKLLRF